MNTITQDIKFRQALIEYSLERGVRTYSWTSKGVKGYVRTPRPKK